MKNWTILACIFSLSGCCSGTYADIESLFIAQGNDEVYEMHNSIYEHSGFTQSKQRSLSLIEQQKASIVIAKN
jgi:hypothetical protein